ncbi:outer membrane beta-barrel protein [Gilvimarinus xylanilyticus]|uniref:Outer membrane beta-barrel protein n=1 Tax=Gilvimarinus xylanilyticus TaxID=2944139 RepID=A0A9X2KWZ6_9GAMM|nr:outer membrane beta-barrel protein [Gilvimarinus xylanilyticus]MCP8899985.1 outer membrane beta-barrel protein [Gilvimarinus xylanilyticus]
MKMKNGLPVIFSSVLALSGVVQADEFPHAKSGLYLGGQVGGSEFKSACHDMAIECEDDDEASGAFLGYRFNDYFAIEGGYHELGEATSWYPQARQGKKSEIWIEGYDLSVLVGLPLSDRWLAYARAGGFFYDANLVDGGDIFLEEQYGSEGWTETVGAGITFRATERLQTRLQYQYINEFGDDWASQPDVQAVTLGVLWQFGNVEGKSAAAPAPAPEPTPVAAPAPEPELQTEPVNVVTEFAFDSAVLQTPEALDHLVEDLNAEPELQVELLVTGYADGAGPAEYNMNLSKERAQVVHDYLVDKGISSSRITVNWKGETEAAGDYPNPEDRKVVVQTELPK